MCEDFFLSLEKCSTYSGDEHIYVFYPDKSDIEEFLKIENVYPSIFVKIVGRKLSPYSYITDARNKKINYLSR
jgi:hypothetical protein